MNRNLLLDTSAYSAATRVAGIKEAIEEADFIFMNAVTLGELLSGFRGGQHYEQNVIELHAFLKREEAEILSIERATAERYAFIRNYLKQTGTPVSPNDLWIAATAMQYGLKLLTTDRDFEKIPQILIELY
jgi:tRNA(fMet)-specific endonuclease VapC